MSDLFTLMSDYLCPFLRHEGPVSSQDFTDTIFSKELVILGSKVKMVTDRLLDLCTLIAKYDIFTSRLHGTTPHLMFVCFNQTFEE